MIVAVTGCTDPDHSLQPLSFDSPNTVQQLSPLGRAIGDSRIVLLGENGHGVGEFTSAKVELIKWLHQEFAFEVVVFESGFFECAHVWERVATLSAPDALLQCLRYPFQHAELLPLFEYFGVQRDSHHPLALAGMDIQAQGFDSDSRPAVLHDVLDTIDPGLADRIATLDTALYLVPDAGGQGDRIYEWVLANGAGAREAYDSAAAAVRGWNQWAFRLATGWVDRVTVRARAESAGEDRPVRYYELRDEWMARAVSALADSIDGRRKVIVYLHNDHGRYGNLGSGGRTTRSAAGYLRDQYGDVVFSVGFFMGKGTVADNGRSLHTVDTPDPSGIEAFLAATEANASYLILRGNRDRVTREWAQMTRPYLRMGTTPMSLVPADEFDALLYIDSVGPPNYRVR